MHYQQFERFSFEIWNRGVGIYREYTDSKYEWGEDHTWLLMISLNPPKKWALKTDHFWYDGPHYNWMIGPICITSPWGPKKAFDYE